MTPRPLGVFLLVAPIIACGDGTTGPADVAFPSLDAAVIAEYCIRGTAKPPESLSGELIVADCPTVFPVGFGPGRYYETVRVRVASTRTVTFRVSSGFDSYLNLFRMTTPHAPVLAVETLIDRDNDDGEGDDAQLSANLLAHVEYWIMISGYTATDGGPYTLEVLAN